MSDLDVLSEMHQRLVALENDNAAIRAELDASKKSGEMGFDAAHVTHVMQKHFYHDRPLTPDASTLGSG